MQNLILMELNNAIMLLTVCSAVIVTSVRLCIQRERKQSALHSESRKQKMQTAQLLSIFMDSLCIVFT